MIITPDILETVANRAVGDDLLTALCAAFNHQFPAFGITGDGEQEMFLAQGSHETAGFQFFTELGGPSYFLKYEGNKSLGNTQAGDGVRFKGRGIFQITGRWNYQHFGGEINVDLVAHPELAAEPDTAVLLACTFWRDRHIGPLAIAGDLDGVTRKINGGLNGLQDRADALQRAKDAFADCTA